MPESPCQESWHAQWTVEPYCCQDLVAARYPLDRAATCCQNALRGVGVSLVGVGLSNMDRTMTRLYKRNPAAETAPLGKGLMVLEPKERKFCALNATSSLIWAKLDEAVSAEQLAKHVVASYQGIEEADALRDVRAMIDEMTSLGIVIPAG